MARAVSGGDEGQALVVPWRQMPLLAVVAVAVTGAVQAAIAATDLPATSNVPAAAITWSVVIGSAVVLAGALVGRLPSWVRSVLVAAGLTGTATAVLALPLHGTAYYFGGLVSDQQFRVQYLTRLTDSPALSDMNYADLPPFYPAGWFWLGGRIAAAAGVDPWVAYKPIAVATVALMPVVVWCVWSRLIGGRTAVAIAAVTLVAGVALSATEPYSWPAAALLPPAAVAFAQVVAAPRAATGRLLAVGVFVGAAGSSYTLYGFFAALLVVVLAALAVVSARADRSAVLRRALRDGGIVAAVGLVVALPAWAPFLLEALRSGVGPNAAARFLPADSARLPDVLGADPWRLLLTLGVLGLVARICASWGRRPGVLAALGVTVACAYAWYAASTLALAGGTTLLAFRMESILVLGLATAGVLVLAELAPPAAAQAARRGWPARRVAVAGGLLTALAATQVLTDRIGDLDEGVEAAWTTPYPSGANARGEVDRGREEGWSDELAAAIDRRTGERPRDTVVLTTNYSMLSFHPYRGFQQITRHYANPLADYEERAEFVAELARSGSTAELLSRLDDAPWAPPTAFVFRIEDDGLHLRLSRDTFPAAPNVEFYDVVFPAELFDGPEFDSVVVGEYLVAVRRT
ncbi:arabinofuranosyltransferase [Blastococcus goldschmidtiae]|uniref:Galactan 5-O-arabinofuranosyltransferase n=1 Tax=Blastococcus goldschmidtiae TaxID=3075546 RepID=A0ABU2K4J0_9ACTN|nr:arabinofuranosyltransferase [Blastococcus sp. DSM 46792]MDT0275123.1 arabinofuranosyltransferase [Blastococcus sp. DSM 46792]